MPQGAAGTKVPRLQKVWSIISLSKITQMWRDHSFTQRNKVTKRAGTGVEQNLKKGGRINAGGSS